MAILDSGNRREFPTGAVRDVQTGKGRCDLLPLEEVANVLFDTGIEAEIIKAINDGIKIHAEYYFLKAIDLFGKAYMNGVPNSMLEVAIHFEEGCEKYGPDNWRKGINTHCYVDSGVRHFLKFLRGDKDERHDRAFVWNMLCLVWTIRNRPECNDLWGDANGSND